MAKYSVLVLEDLDGVRQGLCEDLARGGYDALPAATLDQGRDLAANRLVHLAMVDIHMIDNEDENDLSGLEFAIAPENGHIEMLLMTGRPGTVVYRSIIDASANRRRLHYCAKSDPPDVIMAKVAEVLATIPRADASIVRWRDRSQGFPALAGRLAPDQPVARLLLYAQCAEDLCLRLFAHSRSLTLGTPLAVHNGILWLDAVATDAQGAQSLWMLSLGECQEILADQKSFLSRRLHALAGLAGEPALAQTHHLAALAWPLGAPQRGALRPFDELVAHSPAAEITRTIGDLYTLLTELHEGALGDGSAIESSASPHLLAELWRWRRGDEPLPTAAALEQAATVVAGASTPPWHLGNSASRAVLGVEGEIFEIAHPAHYGNWHLAILVGARGPAHGSIRSATLFADGRQQLLPADFRAVGTLPLLVDFVGLEVDLLLAGARARLADTLPLLRALLNMQSLEQSWPSATVRPGMETLAAALHSVRSAATALPYPAFEAYLCGVWVCLVDELLRLTQEGAPHVGDLPAAQLALLGAGLITARLLPPRGFSFDAVAGTVKVDGHTITLSENERLLVACLVEHRGQICSLRMLAQAINPLDPHPEDASDAVQRAMGRLRKTLEQGPGSSQYLVTVIGRGYKLEND